MQRNCNSLKNTSFFVASFAHWSQSKGGSYLVDCSIVTMLAIEESKFLSAFFIKFLGVLFDALFFI